MKTKNIKKVIKEKLDEWFESIDDVETRNILKANTIVTGGCIPSMLMGEKINDYDIYFRDIEACKAAAVYYVGKFIENNPNTLTPLVQVFEADEIDPDVEHDACELERVKVYIKSRGIVKDSGVEFDEESDSVEVSVDSARNTSSNTKALRDPNATKDKNKKLYKPVFISDNAISLSDKVQLVMRFYGEPEVIHKYFDFVHATSYYTSWNDELVLSPDAMESMLTKDLKYVGSKYPLCSIFRVKKFVERGWMCGASEIVKMAIQLNDFDLTNIAVLREQLIGVDTAYMDAFIRKIETLREEGEVDLTSDYLIKAVDEVFDKPRNEIYEDDSYDDD